MKRRKELPLVTVITPAYNRDDLIEETIKSILSQDYSNIEYIILDDGSKDNTLAVIKKYKDKVIWDSHKNMGETETVNKGIKMAQGDIIVIVNSDDPLLPGAVSTTVEFMQKHPDMLVAYPDWLFIGPKGERLDEIHVPEYDYEYMFTRHHCLPGPGAFIRRRAFNLFGGRDPEFKYVADFDYWLRLGLHGPFARIPKTLATFRTHPGSQSIYAKNDAMAEEHIRVVDKLCAQKDFPKKYVRVKNKAYSSGYFHAAQTYKTKPKALKAYIRSFFFDPFIFLEKVRYELVKIKKRLLSLVNLK